MVGGALLKMGRKMGGRWAEEGTVSGIGDDTTDPFCNIQYFPRFAQGNTC